MEGKKLVFRVIDGGKPCSLEKPDPLNSCKRIGLLEAEFRSVSSQYKKILASRYVERVDDGIKPRLDWRDVVGDKDLLVEQALAEGTASEKSLRIAFNELKSRFGILRQDAALYLAYIAMDREIFGDESAALAIKWLLDSGCRESNDALRCMGFSADDIAQMKFRAPDERKAILEKVLKDKKED